MVIRHSILILEQLSEIEKLISKIESFIDETGIDIDREKLLLKILKNKEAQSTSRLKQKN